MKGFLPVDDFGNLVKNVQRAPEISIEGMPNVKREFISETLELKWNGTEWNPLTGGCSESLGAF